jgi:phosphomannomutase
VLTTPQGSPRLTAELGLPADTERSVREWLDDPHYASEREALTQLLLSARTDAAARAELMDAFSQVLPIGTGGRRGKVGPGPNRLNSVVVRETARGLAHAVKQAGDTPQVAVVYDTRMHSRQFAAVIAEELAAEGLTVILFDAPRPTPELSFLVRRMGCGAGVVVSASHNPPEDNGIKIYGPDGAQVLGARDAALMRAIVGVRSLPARGGEPPAQIHVIAADQVEAEADKPYHAHVLAQGVVPGSLPGAGFSLVFTPLHGVGHTSAGAVLRARGLTVHFVERQCDPDGGKFSTVSSANPEAPASMAMGVELATATGSALVLATDPDADRLGACVRTPDGGFVAIDGNRLGVLMLGHILDTQQLQLPANGWVLTTLVTSPLIGTMARAHGIEVVDDLLVGFKHHAGMMAEHPDKTLVFGCEESHGYIRGDDIRDKDGAIAALLLAECAAVAHAEHRNLFDVLEKIWCRYGYHREKTANLVAPGLAGRQAIAAVMQAWRAQPPAGFGGLSVVRVDDRLAPRQTGSATRDLPGDVLSFELAGDGRGCRIVLRPSGTEPKLKVYALARSAGNLAHDQLPAICADIDGLIDRVLLEAEAAARAVMQPFLSA